MNGRHRPTVWKPLAGFKNSIQEATGLKFFTCRSAIGPVADYLIQTVACGKFFDPCGRENCVLRRRQRLWAALRRDPRAFSGYRLFPGRDRRVRAPLYYAAEP